MARRTGRSLARPSAFWDSCALIPLFANQVSTPQASLWLNSFEVVVWWATPVEIASGLAKLLRQRQFDSVQWGRALKSTSQLAETWSVIPPSTAIRARAIELVKRYDLRAGDSLQLAAALEWSEGEPSSHRFLTFDIRLREAAMLTGFDT